MRIWIIQLFLACQLLQGCGLPFLGVYGDDNEGNPSREDLIEKCSSLGMSVADSFFGCELKEETCSCEISKSVCDELGVSYDKDNNQCFQIL